MNRGVAAGVLASLLLGGGLLLAQPRPATPTADSPETQFVRHMLVHHEQALALSAPMLRRSRDRSLRSVALDITLGQEEQLRQMRGWLAGWGQSQEPRPTPAHARAMGMASAQEVAALWTLPLPQAEASFLRLMIRHHQGAVSMSEPLRDSPQATVRRLARQVVTLQRGEMATMTNLLQVRGGTATPPPTGPQHHH
ncbi:DUF305 domain-containing protein [Deinococcus sp. HMF7620]|uniref:DUF305 domain-containing protein n=1 Tax=Deinococcus arboris TaxID=2682977 RepID=A0A7C9MPH0_9DEIO|nr:DUF305 domain-containing protein [Deinococcus arboris]MVN85564.1 DUF305 domain-containing protein [Deinococcus arboris]